MKKKIKILIFLIAILMAVGCKRNTIDLSGNYTAIELYDENGESLMNQLTMMKALGQDVTLEVKNNGVGTISYFGIERMIVFDLKDMTFTSSSDAETSFTYEDGKLTINDETGKIVFEKIAEESSE